MTAIISDNFRIFNARQFLESLSEGSTDTGTDRSRMYFFVGRPQEWDSFIEIFNVSGAAFSPGHDVYVGTTYASASFKAKVKSVSDQSLTLYNVVASVTPPPGSVLKNNSVTGQAITGVYRYSTDDIPPFPLDNQREKYDIYDDLIAAKRITSEYARPVIMRYNWDLVANPKFDMWKPDYSDTPVSGGRAGKQGATGADSIANAKFYVLNSDYEVFKCIYNGESPANTTGKNAVYEPKTTPSGGQGTYSASTGLFKEGGVNGYVWKYMYTIPTDDVLRFLSSSFMPIVLNSNPSRQATEALAENGAISSAIIRVAGTGFTANTYYANIIGDGNGGIVKINCSSGAMTSVELVNAGTGYTYASVPLVSGTGTGSSSYGLFTDSNLTQAATGLATTGSVEMIISPIGGHGSDFESELNAKRIMMNIRLSYAEGAGDFPVNSDFRRIGIVINPYNRNTTTFATADTLNGVFAVKLNNVSTNYIYNETISQTRTDGTIAYGKVVSWTLDSGSNTPGSLSGVLKYIQTPELHRHNGVVRAFQSNAANQVTGVQSLASGTVNTSYNSTVLGAEFANGIAIPEIDNNSGEIIYVENRRPITRAEDQIEDIKLVIEF